MSTCIDDHDADHCIDGSILTSCVSDWVTGGSSWLRLTLPVPVAVARVDVFANDQWRPANAKPVNVLVGNGDDSVDDLSTWRQCGATPILLTEGTAEVPYTSAECDAGPPGASLPSGRDVLLREATDENAPAVGGRLWIAEVVVYIYAPPPPPQSPPVSRLVLMRSPPPPSSLADGLTARYTHGRPCNDLAVAGVLVHMSDGLEDWVGGKPWNALLHVDHMSASLISALRPTLYRGTDGIILSSETEIACAWDHDIGTQSMVRLGCGTLHSLASCLALLANPPCPQTYPSLLSYT